MRGSDDRARGFACFGYLLYLLRTYCVLMIRFLGCDACPDSGFCSRWRMAISLGKISQRQETRVLADAKMYSYNLCTFRSFPVEDTRKKEGIVR